MTQIQKVIKYLAMAFAIFLTVTIISAICSSILAFFGVIGIINHVNDSKDVINYSNTFTDIKSIDVDVAICELDIKTSDRFYVEASNVPEKFICENVNGKLQIKENTKNSFWSNVSKITTNSKITIYLPIEFFAETATIVTGVGKTNIEALKAEKLNIENGVGELICSGLVSNKASINGGVGSITINNAILNDLTLENGVGSLKMDGLITGNSKLEFGIGKAQITINESKENYQIKTDSGIGTIKIDGQKYTSDTPIDSVIRQNKLDIEGGIGEVIINFKK